MFGLCAITDGAPGAVLARRKTLGMARQAARELSKRQQTEIAIYDESGSRVATVEHKSAFRARRAK